MRHSLFFLTCLLILSGLFSPARAEEWITGKIAAIHPARHELELISEKGPSLTVHYDPQNAPHQMLPGDTLQLWGVFSKTDDRIFTASRIGRGQKRQNCNIPPCQHDPTGVRSRIGRGHGHRDGMHHGRGQR